MLALHIAAAEGSLEAVKFLISQTKYKERIDEVCGAVSFLYFDSCMITEFL